MNQEKSNGKKKKILILEKQERPTSLRMGQRIERKKAISTISSMGGKVRHDSGGRFMVVEVSEEEEKALKKQLRGARIVDFDSDIKEKEVDLDESESLFLEALKIRNSKDYREMKRKSKPGESPEEKKQLSGSCVREEY